MLIRSELALNEAEGYLFYTGAYLFSVFYWKDTPFLSLGRVITTHTKTSARFSLITAKGDIIL